MRKVIVRQIENQVGEFGLNTRLLVEVGEALFHGFGLDFEELRDGVGQFTVAIVEWPDGSVQLVPVHMIKFVKEPAFEKVVD